MKRSTVVSILSAAMAVPLVLSSFAGASQVNLVPNGDFSEGMTGWDDWFPAVSNINATSDEHLFVQGKVGQAEWHFHSVARCIQDVPAASQYTMSANVLFPDNQGRSGRVRARVQSYTTEDCGNSVAQTDPLIPPASGWQDVNYTIDAPAGTQAFRITLGVETWAVQPGEDPNTTLWAEFDNVSITAEVPDGPPADDPQDPPADDPQDPPADDPQDPPADDPQDDPPADDPQEPPADPGVKDEPPVVSDVPPVFEIPGPLGTGHVPPTPVVPAKPDPSPVPQPTTLPDPVQPQPTAVPDPVQPQQPPAADPTPGAGAQPEPTVAPTSPSEPPAGAAPLPPSAGTGMEASDPQRLSLWFAAAAFAVAIGSAGASVMDRRRA